MKISKILMDLIPKVESFLSDNKKWIIIITWPTASWKTNLSISLSEHFSNSEIISADSRQVYKYMDIWTDKVSLHIRNKIKHHQIDIINPDENYSVWDWKRWTVNIISSIQKRWNIPIIVWWTWLYISSIYKNLDIPEIKADFNLREDLETKEANNPWYLHKYLTSFDPEEASKIHPNSLRHLIRAIEIFEKTWIPKSILSKEKPVDFPILLITLWPPKEISNKLIYDRCSKMFEKWLIEETENLLNLWYTDQLQSMQWIWYRETISYINWILTLDDAVMLTARATTRYAKRQRTWFRWYKDDFINKPKENVSYLFYNVSL